MDREQYMECFKCFCVFPITDLSVHIPRCPIRTHYPKRLACETYGLIKSNLYNVTPNTGRYVDCFWCGQTIKNTFYNNHKSKCTKRPEKYDEYKCICHLVKQVGGIENYLKMF